MSINWLAHPKDTNFDAALSYLILAVGHPAAKRLFDKLHAATIEEFAAKDILRAADTQALPLQTEHVQDNLKIMKKGQEIGPVLLCRGARSRSRSGGDSSGDGIRQQRWRGAIVAVTSCRPYARAVSPPFGPALA
jgi:hypothetical protein